MQRQGLIFFLVSMEKTGILILFLYTCMGIGATSTKRGYPTDPIGQGINVMARVFYDSHFNNSDADLPTYFNHTFQKVQEGLNNRSIMLNFTLQETTQNDSLAVFLPNDTRRQLIINGSATLEALITLARTETPNLTALYYYFSGYEIFENSTYRADDLHTNNTFCTGVPAATVLNTLPLPGFFLTAYKMTIFTLGSTRTPQPTEEDYNRMNATFQRCMKKEEEAKETTTSYCYPC
ncbi:uncharacterized protein LOC142564864 [Dermacentor variabilis]|uniref:uncharacterized protein LOC142564864 n=1 Tax=Dermacentor variabilis TaxID=34621 RepID=UPI003F5B604A